jgi:hypothetical protein
MLLHLDTLFWFRDNQSLLLLLNNYQFYSLWFDPTGLEPTIYRTRGEHTNHYTTDAVIEIGTIS